MEGVGFVAPYYFAPVVILVFLGIFELLCLLTQCWWRPRDLHGWFGSFFEMLRMAILTPKKPCLVGQGGDYVYAMFNVTVTPLLRKHKSGDRRYAFAFMII